MAKRYIVSIDAGTTSVRTSLFDTKTNKLINIFGSKISQDFPHNGWVNQDAEEIWYRIHENLSKTLKNVNEDEIYGMGITNQRETVVMWDAKTGKPVGPAISWQCKRTEEFCKKLYNNEKARNTIKEKTGLIVNSYFSASKIKWLLDNVYDSVKLFKQNRLCCGTLDSYLIFRLTEGRKFVTEPSNASRTMLFNIYTSKWDETLLKMFAIPESILPEVVDSDSFIDDVLIDGKTIKLGGVLGDQQASLMGQACLDEGNIKNTYGSGSFLLLNLGKKPKTQSSNMLTTVAWRIKGENTYALEGSVYNAGTCVKWMQEQMHFIDNAKQSEDLAVMVKDADGVVFVPAFNGLGAPFWNDDLRAGFYNITQNTTKSHCVRAVLESVANNVRAIIDQMQKDSKININEIRVDGGMTANAFFMQYQSDLLNKEILVAKEPESTSLGVAFLSGLIFGAYSDFDDIRANYKIGKTYKPSKLKDGVNKCYDNWLKIVNNLVNKNLEK